MNLGENIYKYRTQKRMSQGDLADALDVSRQSVSKWENNNAVPDLEKLVKMSALFEISLDELVGKSVQTDNLPTTETVPTPPVQQVIIQTQFRPIGIRQILGVIFICIGLLFLPFALSATRYDPMCICLILSGLFTLCGVSILIFRYPCLPCCWLLLISFTLYVFLLLHWETAYLELALIGALLVIMLWWTVDSHKKGIIKLPTWLWWTGGLILAGLLILFCINFFPAFWITSSSDAAIAG